MRLTKALKWTALGAVFAAFGLWLVRIFLPLQVSGDEGLLATAWAVVIFSLVALACAATLEQGRAVGLMWSGIGAAGFAAAGWSAYAFLDPLMTWESQELFARLMFPFSAWAVYCALVALLLRYRMPGTAGRFLRAATLACAGALALIMAFPPLDAPSPLLKAMGVLAVLSAFGTVMTMVLARLPQLTGAGEDVHEVRMDFTATCPRCGVRQGMVTGGHACSRCGLRVTVRVP